MKKYFVKQDYSMPEIFALLLIQTHVIWKLFDL